MNLTPISSPDDAKGGLAPAALAAAFAAARDGLFIVDETGRLLAMNRAAEDLTGWAAGEILGTPLHHLLVPGDDHLRIDEGFRRFAVTGEGPVVGKTLELTLRHRGGAGIPIELSVAAFRCGQAWHAVGVCRGRTASDQ